MKTSYFVPVGLGLTLAVALSFSQPALAQRTLSDGIADLAAQISSSVTQQQKKKVAIIAFKELDGRATVLGTYVSEALVTQMFKLGGLEIVERTMLDRILAELKLGQSGLIDPNAAKQVGQMAGVDAIVTGTLTDLQSYVAVNCRLIDVQSGRVFAAAEAKIVKDDDVRKIMGVELGQPASIVPGPAGAGPSSRGRATEWTSRELRLQVIGIRRAVNETRLTLLATNLGQDNEMLYFFRTQDGQPSNESEWRNYLVDDLGNRYHAVGGTMFDPHYRFASSTRVGLVPNIPLRVDLVFDALNAAARSVTFILRGQGFFKTTATIGPMSLSPGSP